MKTGELIANLNLAVQNALNRIQELETEIALIKQANSQELDTLQFAVNEATIKLNLSLPTGGPHG